MDQTRMELLAISTARLLYLIDTVQATLKKTAAPANPVGSACCEALLELVRALAEYTENDLALHCEAQAWLRELRTELDAINTRVGVAETPARPHLVLAWDQETSER